MTTATHKTFKVGDRVLSNWGETTITKIEVCAPGEKYGHEVQYATKSQKDCGMVVIDMANKHWARSDEFEVVQYLESKPSRSSFTVSKKPEADYFEVEIEKERVHDHANGNKVMFLELAEMQRLKNMLEAVEMDSIPERGLDIDELVRNQERANLLHDTYDPGCDYKEYDFEG